MKLINVNNVEQIKNKIKENTNFPFINIYHSTLGGDENISLLLTISLSKKENWSFGILENSDYIKLHISCDGVIENITSCRVKRFRKCKVKTIDAIIGKLNKNIKAVQYAEVL